MPDGVAAVVVAAGRGTRVGADVPKQYRSLGGQPVVRHALEIFAKHPQISAVQPVIHADDASRFRAASDGLALRPIVFGGATRQASVCAGLEALAELQARDRAGARCSAAVRVGGADFACDRGGRFGAAVPGLAPTDTVKSVDAVGRVTGTIDRNTLRAVQTPQAFDYAALLDAHHRAIAAGRDDFTDDAALAEWAGHDGGRLRGRTGNIKITTEEDFARREADYGGADRRSHRHRL